MVKAVLFDLDGLMFDTEPIWSEIWKPTLETFGLQVKPGLDDACRGTTKGSLAAKISEFYGDAVNPWAVIARMDELADERFRKPCPKKPGLDELLEFLSVQGIGCAVASSSSQDIICNHLKNGGIAHYFQSVVAREQIVNAKPAPDVFLKAAEALGQDPCECVVLEDSINGVTAGLSAGCQTIMVPDLIAPTQMVLESSCVIARDLYEAQKIIAQRL